MRNTVREQYAAALTDALDSLGGLRRSFEKTGDLVLARSELHSWREDVAGVVETFGSLEDLKLWRAHVDLDVKGLSGSTVLDWFESFEGLLKRVIRELPTSDVRRGYAEDVRVPLEQIDELVDWLRDNFRRSMRSGKLDYQTAEDGLRRWRDRAYAVLTDLLGEDEAGQIFHLTPSDASWGNPEGSIEEQYEMYLKYLDNIKEDLQKYPHHVAAAAHNLKRGGGPVYVDTARLRELRGIRAAQHDLSRLIALCEELNVTAAGGAHHATAMLVRAVMDHVPPVFGVTSFAQVASNYSGSRSFKEAMTALETAARKISDGHLHTQIRPRETLPTATQVNFSPQLDLLLAEVVRILK